MRAARAAVTILAISLLAGAARAQATQPAGEIRRSAAAAASSAPAAAGPSATRVALSLAAVLALVVVLFLAVRRFLPRGSFGEPGSGRGGGGAAVQVLARHAIAPKQRIILLQVGRRILVVADGGNATLNTLCEIIDADEAAALIGQLQSDRGGNSFGAALNSAMERFRSAQHEQPPTREPQPSVDAMREEIEGLARRVRGMAR